MSANIISVDEESLRNDIENLVRKTVEETPDALLDEEASELVEAGRYEGGAGRPTAAVTTRGGSSRAPGKSSSACRSSAGRPRGRCATGSPRR